MGWPKTITKSRACAKLEEIKETYDAQGHVERMDEFTRWRGSHPKTVMMSRVEWNKVVTFLQQECIPVGCVARIDCLGGGVCIPEEIFLGEKKLKKKKKKFQTPPRKFHTHTPPKISDTPLKISHPPKFPPQISPPRKFQTPPPKFSDTPHPPGSRHPPPVNRITDTCKNITLAQLRCGR